MRIYGKSVVQIISNVAGALIREPPTNRSNGNVLRLQTFSLKLYPFRSTRPLCL